MPDRSRKRPADANKLAKSIVDRATGSAPDPDAGNDPAAVALGRKGGLKGGAARAKTMTPGQRSRQEGSGGALEVETILVALWRQAFAIDRRT